jgi:PAS domain S-box-containing protein
MKPPLNLLIIEDQPDDFLLIQRHLHQQGLTARCQRVATLEELKTAVDRDDWDAVLSDHNVPELDFKEALGVLQTRHPDLPLILVSGSIGEETAVELLKLGVVDFVHKNNLSRLVPALERSQREAADRRARQAAEAALRASEERYRSLFENMLNGLAYCRMIFAEDRPRDFLYLAVNQAFETLTGLKNVAGRRVTEVIPGIRETDPELLEIYGRVARTGVPERFEAWVEALQNWFTIAVYSPGRDHFVAVFDVITERKQAVESLRASEANFRALFELAAIGMAQTDPRTGRFLRVNQKMCALTGYAQDELLNMSYSEITHPADRQTDWENKQRAIRDKVPDYRLEKRYLRKDGSLAWVNVNVTVIRDAAGQILRTMAAIEDITGRKQAEAALRDSEEKYRGLFENSRDAIMLGDPASGRFLAGNPAARAMFGARDETELTAHDVLDSSPERQPDGRASAEKAREMFATALQKGSHCFEWRHRRINGEEFLADVLLTRMERAGQPVILATVRDITARKLVEAELRLNQEILEETGRIAHVGGWSFDVLTGAGFWTDEVARIHDLDPALPISKDTGLQFFAGESRSRIEAAVKLAVEQAIPYDLELEIVSARGVPKWVRTIGHPVKENGRVVRVRGSFQDITGRRRSEEAHARLATAAAQAAETIVITDLHGTILYANPAFEKTSGYTCAEVLGQNPRFLKSDRHDPGFYRQMWDVLQRGETWRGHFVNRRKEGALFEEDATISPVRDAAGKIVNYVAVKRDVTREVQLEAQFRQAQKMEAIGTLAGGIADDFNNILSAIFGYGYLLQQDTQDNAPAQESVREILQAANRAKDLVQQILTFSRQREQKRAVIHLDAVLKEVGKFLRASLPAEIKIAMNLADDAPAVLADPTQIYQVTVNLATNALHAMEGRPGRLTLSLDAFLPGEEIRRAHPELQPVPYARLIVADTGHGMDAPTLERIFEPFFTTKPVGKGTGLGLSVVHGIVQSHEGVITVESQPGCGTTFSLYFPAKTAAAALTVSPAGHLPHGLGQSILLVDDEPTLTAMYQRLLSELNYQVTVSNRPREALAWCAEQPARFELVITDLTMPELNGLDVARQLRALRPELPVILVSGVNSALNDNLRREAGLADLLEKPVSMTALAGAVHRVLTSRGE